MGSGVVRSAGLVLGLLLFTSACGGSSPPPASAAPALAPTMTIERFLRAANQNDLDTMGALFGTRDGPITQRERRKTVDTWMYLLANVLRHSDYRIGSEQVVPGRRDVATMYNVNMVINNNTVTVPFTLVRARTGGWLIEEIGVEKITRPVR